MTLTNIIKKAEKEFDNWRTFMTPENIIKKTKEEFRKYWYHAGQWHEAECDFVLYDQGNCNCELSKNRKAVKQAITKAVKEAYYKGLVKGAFHGWYSCLKKLF